MIAALVSAALFVILISWMSNLPDPPPVPQISAVPFDALRPIGVAQVIPEILHDRLSSSEVDSPPWLPLFAAPTSRASSTDINSKAEALPHWSIFKSDSTSAQRDARSTSFEQPGMQTPTSGGGLFQAPPAVVFPTRARFSFFQRFGNLFGTRLGSGGSFRSLGPIPGPTETFSGGAFRSPGAQKFLGRRLSSSADESAATTNFSWGNFFGFSFEEPSASERTADASIPSAPGGGLGNATSWTSTWSWFSSWGARLRANFKAFVKFCAETLTYLCGPSCVYLGYVLGWLPYLAHLVWIVPLALALLLAHTVFTWVILPLIVSIYYMHLYLRGRSSWSAVRRAFGEAPPHRTNWHGPGTSCPLTAAYINSHVKGRTSGQKPYDLIISTDGRNFARLRTTGLKSAKINQRWHYGTLRFCPFCYQQ
jgi:hypothetical protein